MSEKLKHIAALAHNGGLADLSEHEVLVAIRRLTIDDWDRSGDHPTQRIDVYLAVAAAGGVGR